MQAVKFVVVNGFGRHSELDSFDGVVRATATKHRATMAEGRRIRLSMKSIDAVPVLKERVDESQRKKSGVFIRTSCACQRADLYEYTVQ